jgi:hypothetical protein
MDHHYRKYKHKIDFYLSENNITDFTKFYFTLTSNHDVDIRKEIIDLKIIDWDYNIEQPTKEVLDNLKSNPKFKIHRKDNLIIGRLEFILKIVFKEGEYNKGLIICEDYKDLPYEWFITPRCNMKNTNDIFLRFIAKDSILYMNMELNVAVGKRKTFYLNCLLVPEKEINIDSKHNFTFRAVPISDGIESEVKSDSD